MIRSVTDLIITDEDDCGNNQRFYLIVGSIQATYDCMKINLNLPH